MILFMNLIRFILNKKKNNYFITCSPGSRRGRCKNVSSHGTWHMHVWACPCVCAYVRVCACVCMCVCSHVQACD